MRISIFDLIMDSRISKVFVNAVTAINMKGLRFKLVCLILFVFFLNSATCQQRPDCPVKAETCSSTIEQCSALLCSPVSLCCFDGCRNICYPPIN
ncbi:UNVERIFIED_CONTAM: hypothetical protein RMT77_011115 [Armadillidium vulgare]